MYTAAGNGKSTTDLAWDGQTSIFENGVLLAEGDRFARERQIVIADVDLDLLVQERSTMGTFDDNRIHFEARGQRYRKIPFSVKPSGDDVGFKRTIERFPFVPSDKARLEQDCYEGYNIQVAALVQRLEAIGVNKVVIGVSGGLDSTHALIVASRAMDLLGHPRKNVLAYTLPGFATGPQSKSYALALMLSLEVSSQELDIRPAATQILGDIGHPFGQGKAVYDITFENVQAGLRTDYLFRLANYHDGIVVGTGDLSELALGWCTYGVGDQMAHYNVNAGVPKTLIQHLIRWVISSKQFDQEVCRILKSDPSCRNLARVGARRRGRNGTKHRGDNWPLRTPGFQPVLYVTIWIPTLEDSFPSSSCVGITLRGSWPLVSRSPTDIPMI